MTAKHYFRNLALQDLGFPADSDVIELHEYITERLSNLNQYTSDKYPEFIIFYGKSKDEMILDYNSKKEYINLYYDHFSRKLFNHFNLQLSDIEVIISKYVVDTLQINVNYISITGNGNLISL